MARPEREGSGPARMRALAASMPASFREGFRAGVSIAPPATDHAGPVFVVGMGGSAISAELARGLLEAETALSLAVVRSPDLPHAVGDASRVILVSYSGNTWETLRAYDAAGRARASRVVVTSGGALADRAEDDGVPILPLPPALPPRAAVGNLLGGLLGLLDPWFPESNESRVGRVADRVAAQVPGFARARGPAAAIASRIARRVPVVYAESSFGGLARRWKTQIEENAKRVAFFDEVPELFHNAIVGWDATPRTEAARYALILLEWAEEATPTQRSFAYFDRLLRTRGAAVVRVPLGATDRLEALLAGISLGDHVSLFLAAARHTDPLPVDAIARLKVALGLPAEG